METQKNKAPFKEIPGFFAGALILFIFLNIFTISFIFTPKTELVEGMVSDKTIKSPRTVYFKSITKTEEAQAKAAEKVEKVYKFDPSIEVQQKSKTEEVFKKIDTIREANPQDKASQIASAYNLNLSDEISSYIGEMGVEDWQMIKSEVLKVLTELQEKEKIRNDEKFPSESIEKKIPGQFTEKNRTAIKELVSSLLISNYIFSKNETDKEAEKTKAETEPVSLLLAKDEVIVNSGKVIDKLDLEKLEAVGLKTREFFNPKTFGIITFSLIVVLMAVFYFKYFFVPPQSVTPFSRLKAFYIFLTFFLLTVLGFQVLAPLKPIMAYVIPVAASVLLVSILISSEVAVFSAIIISSFLGVISGSLELSVIYLITSLVGVYSIKFVNRLEDIFRIGIFLAAFNFFVATTFHLIAGSFSPRTISVLLGAASIYGLGSVVLIIGTLLFWGNVFKITTILELLELENPNQSLLKDLSLKAPGTYHHSILVSNLAEKAAQSIGANTFLVRVGAFYHDIGKTINPSYFIENQKRYNIHDKLKDPEKSASLIKDHVLGGVELAKKEKLPKEIIHFIESHHGTSEVFYFLSKAKEQKLDIDLSKFHYEGPLPQTREAAILMLADSIEAKARSEPHLTGDSIKELVFEVVDSKLKTGQLDKSELTLKEIGTLKGSFIDVLRTMYHKRIEYPDVKK